MESKSVKELFSSKKNILLISLSIFILLIGFFSVLNRAEWREPYIGLQFSTDESGFVYLHPKLKGPAFLSGVREDDSLLQIESLCYFSDGSAKKTHWMLNNRNKIVTSLLYKGKIIETWIEQINDVREIGKIAYEYSNNTVIRLLIHRGTKPPQEVSFPVEMRIPEKQFEYFFFTFIGLLTLIIGVVVLFAKKPGFEGRTVFFLFSLDIFVLLSYSYTNAGAPFSQMIFFFDTIARIFFAPIFLHFLIKVIGVKKKKKIIEYLIYFFPSLLILAEIAIHYYDKLFDQRTDYIPKLNTEFLKLQNIELFVLAAYIVISALILAITYKRTPSIVLKRQLKLILIGIVTGFFPLILVYLPMYFKGEEIPSLITILTGLPLIMVPLSLGYATIRHRLMDIELQLLRGLTYAVALTILISIYISTIILMLILFPDFETEPLILVLALFTLFLAIMFEPFHNRLKIFLDKILYRENYDFRLTLSRFSLELGSEHNLRELLYSLVSRLFLTFTISRASAFVYNKKRKVFEALISYPELINEKIEKKFQRGMKLHEEFSKILSDYILFRREGGALIQFEEMRDIKEEYITDLATLEKYSCDYLIPLNYRDGTPAIIALSRKINGDLLTTEDLELLNIIRMPAAIACDNANMIETIIKQNLENKELLEFNSSILESMRGAVLVIDQAKKVTQVNSTFSRIFKIAPEEARGKNINQILPKELNEKLLPHVEPTLFEDELIYNFYKLPYSTPDRKLFFNISISPLMKDGFPNGYVIVIEDVSKNVLLEDQIIQTEKLASLGMMAAGMAHEVNTPLAGISSYIQMLIKQTSKKTETHDTLKKIEEQAQRIKNLVSRLLNFSRPKEAEYSDIDLNDIIRETQELFGKQITKTGTDLNLKLNKKPLIIYGDHGRIQQVLINLLINAKDSLKENGIIDIKSYKESDFAVLSVEDNGIGISEDHLRRIYDPFFTTKKDTGGTGLGLSISYAIIRDHLGTIAVKSRLYKGTAFIVRLPLSSSRGK